MPYRLSVQRHDHHNLEIKLALELSSASAQADLQYYFFMPSNAHMASLEKSRIMSDFHSRARLTFAGTMDRRQQALSEIALKLADWLQDLRRPGYARLLEQRHGELTLTIRQYGTLISEALKSLGEAHARDLFMTHSLNVAAMNPLRSLYRLSSEIDNTFGLSLSLREALCEDLLGRVPELEALEFYIHHLHIEYLSLINEEFERIKAIPVRFEREAFAEGWQVLEATLQRWQKFEAERASELLRLFPVDRDPIAQEQRLLRLSHMKKFFQSSSFVELTRKETIKKVTEPVAVFGAAFAALWASVFERVSNPMFTKFGFQSLALICAGIVLYTFRDRFKDWTRNYVLRRLSGVVADVEQELISEGRKLGRVKEWFVPQARARVPETVKGLRAQACISQSEKHLEEDVLAYRKITALDGDSRGDHRGFQDVLRVNFERYLKYFDDKQKTLRLLDQSGKLTTVFSHRVYHFHLAVEGTLLRGDERLPVRRFFRLVMDKQGIDRVEEIQAV